MLLHQNSRVWLSMLKLIQTEVSKDITSLSSNQICIVLYGRHARVPVDGKSAPPWYEIIISILSVNMIHDEKESD